MEILRQFDHSLFHFINHTITNPVFDWLCPLLRHKLTWVPLYIALAVIFYRKYHSKVFIVVLFVALTILLTDQLSSSLIKPFFHRLRPCNNPNINARLLLDYCGSGYSFVSSHAANHFGMAVLIACLFENKRRALILLLSWATAISFSQVYVGVHYPSDVVAGALLGALIGIANLAILKTKFTLHS